MLLVEGNYCSEPEQPCLVWLDKQTLPYARCAKYDDSPRCKGEREHKRFCIDRFEHAEAGGPPLNNQSYVLAGRICREQGKRLCSESEWNFACEGEAMLPYPYGFERRQVCNQDRSDLFEMVKGRQVLKDLTLSNTLGSACKSPFGVINMVGNLDEPVRRESGTQPNFNNGLKGGWWMAGRNRCRPATTAHDDYYRGLQIGVRCCAEPAAK
jgi:formylglycine-generating enzyme required for sulfatase activity